AAALGTGESRAACCACARSRRDRAGRNPADGRRGARERCEREPPRCAISAEHAASGQHAGAAVDGIHQCRLLRGCHRGGVVDAAVVPRNSSSSRSIWCARCQYRAPAGARRLDRAQTMWRPCQALRAGGSRRSGLWAGWRLPDHQGLLRRSVAGMSASWMASWSLPAARPIVDGLLTIMLLTAVVLSRHSRGRDAHRRGTRVLQGGAAQRRTARLQLLRREPLVTLAGVGILPDEEAKHFKLIGSTGTGKSTAIRELLAAALDRGDRAVITDPDGGYLAHFHDP